VKTELNTHPDAYTDGRATILKIVQEGEFICQSLVEDAGAISATQEALNPTPEAEIETPTATPTQ
jgi:hypothetical protein